MESGRSRRLVPLAGVLLVAAAYLGCAAVPDIRFVDDTGDGGPSILGDGGKNDGAKDGSSGQDATTSCTAPNPGGGTCCGEVWCIGECSGTNCDLCAASCPADEFCCGKMGNVMCKPHCP